MLTMLNRSIQPATSDFSALNLPSFDETILPNGVKLYTLDSSDEAVTRTTVMWNVGLVDVDNSAALGLMANMLSEGCGNLNGQEVSNILESNGAWFRGSATRHSFVLTLHCLNHTASDIFSILGSIIAKPTFPEEALESIKQKQASEKEVTQRKPSYQANLIARQALYGEGHRLARQVSAKDILAVKRDELVELHQGIMLANVPTIFISGKVTEEILSIAKSVFGSLEFSIDSLHSLHRIIDTPEPLTATNTVTKEMPESMQTAIRIQIPTIKREHPDFDTLRFAIIALGGYFGSRLMSNIREDKGYTYGITASLIPSLEGSNIIISCECDNKYCDAVITEINNEINRLATEPMPAEELLTVRSVLVSALANVLDSPFTISSFREMLTSLGLSDSSFNHQFNRAMTITSEEVMEISQKYIKEAPYIIALAGGQPS
jgi:predicted Zn-dependent peptidase